MHAPLSWRAHATQELSCHWLKIPLTLKSFQQCKKQVACFEDRIVGFVGVSKNEIGWLYVDPKESGKGFGRILLRNALAAIDAKASVYVLQGNTPALNLYLSEGFTIVDTFNSRNNGYPCTVLKLSKKNTE